MKRRVSETNCCRPGQTNSGNKYKYKCFIAQNDYVYIHISRSSDSLVPVLDYTVLHKTSNMPNLQITNITEKHSRHDSD